MSADIPTLFREVMATELDAVYRSIQLYLNLEYSEGFQVSWIFMFDEK